MQATFGSSARAGRYSVAFYSLTIDACHESQGGGICTAARSKWPALKTGTVVIAGLQGQRLFMYFPAQKLKISPW